MDPAEWLLEAVSDAVEEHVDLFHELHRNGLDDLEDVNLDSGRPLAEESGHADAAVARGRLASLAEA